MRASATLTAASRMLIASLDHHLHAVTVQRQTYQRHTLCCEPGTRRRHSAKGKAAIAPSVMSVQTPPLNIFTTHNTGHPSRLFVMSAGECGLLAQTRTCCCLLSSSAHPTARSDPPICVPVSTPTPGGQNTPVVVIRDFQFPPCHHLTRTRSSRSFAPLHIMR